jgi:hypothetical protein
MYCKINQIFFVTSIVHMVQDAASHCYVCHLSHFKVSSRLSRQPCAYYREICCDTHIQLQGKVVDLKVCGKNINIFPFVDQYRKVWKSLVLFGELEVAFYPIFQVPFCRTPGDYFLIIFCG